MIIVKFFQSIFLVQTEVFAFDQNIDWRAACHSLIIKIVNYIKDLSSSYNSIL